MQKVLPFVRAIIAPAGRILFLKVVGSFIDGEHQENKRNEGGRVGGLKDELAQIVAPLNEDGLFVEHSVIEADDNISGIVTSLQLSKDMFFRPNTMFCVIDDGEHSGRILKKAAQEGLGLMALKFHEENGFGYEKVVNLWIRRNSPNIHLAVLAALQIQGNWDGQVRILQAVSDESQASEAWKYLEMLKATLRFPKDTILQTLVGDFRTVLMTAPKGDVNIFGMADQPDVKIIHEVFEMVGTSVLFLRDSEFESAAV